MQKKSYIESQTSYSKYHEPIRLRIKTENDQ